jgi:hypothetical protein
MRRDSGPQRGSDSLRRHRLIAHNSVGIEKRAVRRRATAKMKAALQVQQAAEAQGNTMSTQRATQVAA